MPPQSLAEAYDVAFEVAQQAEKETDKAIKLELLKDTVVAFRVARGMEKAARNLKVLDKRLAGYDQQITRLEDELADLPSADNKVKLALAQDKAGNEPGATSLYMDAAQEYLRALKQASVLPIQAARWRDRANKAMVRLEEMKKATVGASLRPKSGSRRSSGASVKSAPRRSSDSSLSLYTNEEKQVLKESSWINGKLFVPWQDSDATHDDFITATSYTDPQGKLDLSAKQNKALAKWKRATDLLGDKPRIVAQVDPVNVTQEIVCDCSFVSSLCIAAHLEKHFKTRLISGIIFPQRADGKPVFNHSGKYAVKLWYNGAARKVVVDDWFPIDRKGHWLCSYSRNPNELWVSIIEKAYMKLNGGFDFPGSVSGIDLYSLTGWIPEQYSFGKKLKNRDETWTKLLDASGRGDVLTTVATGAIPEDEAESLGLVASHAYAVLSVCEVGGRRLVQLKNPWSRVRWKGNYSFLDRKNWTKELCEALQYDLGAAQRSDNGIFWIDYDSLLASFHALYLNWNPKLFKHRLVLHRQWPTADGPRDDSYNVGANPQFCLSVNVPNGQASGIVWLLLSRHVTRKEQLLSQDKGDFLTISVYDRKNGGRVYYPEKSMIRGVYGNNPHCLVTFQVPPGKHKYTLVVSLFEKTRAVNYTLTAFCTQHFSDPSPLLVDVPKTLKFSHEVQGSWGAHTAGGSPKFPGFPSNPQYVLIFKTKKPRKLHLRLLAPKEFPINVRLYNNDGKRLYSATSNLELASSGPYRKGFCVLELSDGHPALEEGVKLTVVVSTIDPDSLGPFILHIESDSAYDCEKVQPEGYGMQNSELVGEWLGKNAVGCPNHGHFKKNPRFFFEVLAADTKLTARLQYVPPNGIANCKTWPPLNLALFSEKHSTENTLDKSLSCSGDGVYMNVPSGVVIERERLAKGTYCFVPSTFDPFEGKFKVSIWSSHNIRHHTQSEPSYVNFARSLLRDMDTEFQRQDSTHGKTYF